MPEVENWKKASTGELRWCKVWFRYHNSDVWHKSFHLRRGLGGKEELLEITAQSLWAWMYRGSRGAHFVGCFVVCIERKKQKWGFCWIAVTSQLLCLISWEWLLLARTKICLTLCPGSVASWMKVMSLYFTASNGLVFFSSLLAPHVSALLVLIWSGVVLIVSKWIFKAPQDLNV